MLEIHRSGLETESIAGDVEEFTLDLVRSLPRRGEDERLTLALAELLVSAGRVGATEMFDLVCRCWKAGSRRRADDLRQALHAHLELQSAFDQALGYVRSSRLPAA